MNRTNSKERAQGKNHRADDASSRPVRKSRASAAKVTPLDKESRETLTQSKSLRKEAIWQNSKVSVRGGKTGKLVEMLKRSGGASLADLVKASGWQQHSVRGFLSTVSKKHGLNLVSEKALTGQRIYSVKA